MAFESSFFYFHGVPVGYTLSFGLSSANGQPCMNSLWGTKTSGGRASVSRILSRHIVAGLNRTRGKTQLRCSFAIARVDVSSVDVDGRGFAMLMRGLCRREVTAAWSLPN